jgi:hypothetical protein
MTGDDLAGLVRADSLALLDEQLANLSERVFELGRSADRQLFLWLTFAALTVLFGFGLTERASVAGLELDPDVATIIAYGLSCIVYARHALSTAALGVWREMLKELRETRYKLMLELAEQHGPEPLEATRREIRGLIREYPGYLAMSVVLKDEAARHDTPAARYLWWLYHALFAVRLLAPYALAAVALAAVGITPAAVAVVVSGIAVTLTGNALVIYRS